MFAGTCSFTKNCPLCMAYHPYHFVGEVLLHPVYYPGSTVNRGEEWLGFPDLWPGQKPWFNLYLMPVVNFGEVRRDQLAKSNLLTSTMGAPGIFSDLLRCVQVLKRERGCGKQREAIARTYSSLVKLQPWFLSLQLKICLWQSCKPWCLSLQWKTCPWEEHSNDGDCK